MDRLVAAAVRAGDCYPKVVEASGAVPGEIQGHLQRITRSQRDLNLAACILNIYSVRSRMAPKPEVADAEIGELWRRYRPLEGRDDHAGLILALIRKLIVQQARNIP